MQTAHSQYVVAQFCLMAIKRLAIRGLFICDFAYMLLEIGLFLKLVLKFTVILGLLENVSVGITRNFFQKLALSYR